MAGLDGEHVTGAVANQSGRCWCLRIKILFCTTVRMVLLIYHPVDVAESIYIPKNVCTSTANPEMHMNERKLITPSQPGAPSPSSQAAA